MPLFFKKLKSKNMTQVKLKDETERITFNGRSADITRENLTWEKYEWVKLNHPALVTRFEVIEEKEVSKPKTKE